MRLFALCALTVALVEDKTYSAVLKTLPGEDDQKNFESGPSSGNNYDSAILSSSHRTRRRVINSQRNDVAAIVTSASFQTSDISTSERKSAIVKRDASKTSTGHIHENVNSIYERSLDDTYDYINVRPRQDIGAHNTKSPSSHQEFRLEERESFISDGPRPEDSGQEEAMSPAPRRLRRIHAGVYIC